MVEAKLNEGIKLELLETESCCEPDCSPETCGPGCAPVAEQPQAEVPVIAGGSGEGCCSPGCGPDTCGTS